MGFSDDPGFPLLFYTEAVCRAIVGEEGRMGVKVITSPDPRLEEGEPTEEKNTGDRRIVL